MCIALSFLKDKEIKNNENQLLDLELTLLYLPQQLDTTFPYTADGTFPHDLKMPLYVYSKQPQQPAVKSSIK